MADGNVLFTAGNQLLRIRQRYQIDDGVTPALFCGVPSNSKEDGIDSSTSSSAQGPTSRLEASFKTPTAICTDGDNLYVADDGLDVIHVVPLEEDNDCVIHVGPRMIHGAESDKRLKVHDLAFVAAVTAEPSASNSLFLVHPSRSAVYQIPLSNSSVMITYAGNEYLSGSRDGPIKEASFQAPERIVVGPSQRLYVSDGQKSIIRLIDLQLGTVSTLGYGPLSDAGISSLTWCPGWIESVLMCSGTSFLRTDFNTEMNYHAVLPVAKSTTTDASKNGRHQRLAQDLAFNSIGAMASTSDSSLVVLTDPMSQSLMYTSPNGASTDVVVNTIGAKSLDLKNIFGMAFSTDEDLYIGSRNCIYVVRKLKLLLNHMKGLDDVLQL